MHERAAVVRLPLKGPIFALVEDWRRSQPKIPSRNEAIRLLLRRALERSSEKSEPAVECRSRLRAAESRITAWDTLYHRAGHTEGRERGRRMSHRVGHRRRPKVSHRTGHI
jgi:hypothetical protein